MNFDEYVEKAKDTDLGHKLEYYFAGLGEEAGEVLGKRKRLIRGDYKSLYHPFDYDDDLKNELGDLLWYIAIICDKQGFSFNEVVENNIKKLQDRKERNKIKGKGDSR